MRYFWLMLGGLLVSVAVIAGITVVTLEVLARVWNPAVDVRVEDLAGRWVGSYPSANDVIVSIESDGDRANVDRWPANLDCNVGRIDDYSSLADIRWTPNSSFAANLHRGDETSGLSLDSYADESCPRSLSFTVEQNARSGELRILYQVGGLDDDTLDQVLIFSR